MGVISWTMFVCVLVALLLLVQTSLAQPIRSADGQSTEEAVLRTPEDSVSRRRRSVGLMQLAMRTFLNQAIEAIPTEGEDRLITNEICMNNTCLTLEMDLRDLTEGGDEEEAPEQEEEV